MEGEAKRVWKLILSRQRENMRLVHLLLRGYETGSTEKYIELIVENFREVAKALRDFYLSSRAHEVKG